LAVNEGCEQRRQESFPTTKEITQDWALCVPAKGLKCEQERTRT
jgi:hypothetical protein